MLDLHSLEATLNATIVTKEALRGGNISDVYKLVTDNGMCFLLKTSSGNNSEMYKAEAEGLIELNNSNSFRVPKVITFGTDYIVTEFIEKGKVRTTFNEEFADNLSNLHKFTSKAHGFKSNNFIGSNIQVNSSNHSWKEFFWGNRILFQIKMADKNNLLTKELITLVNKLESKIDAILSHKPLPSLLHGDLWSGNYLIDEKGSPVLIDPAVYYGDKETDLAMMKLFGGFSEKIFEEYQNYQPLPDGWEEREYIYKLYHLLNHMNLFGSGYYHDVLTTIKYYL